MRFNRDHIEKMHMLQLEHLRQKLKGAETKRKSIKERNDFLEKQNNINYRNEHDRILGELTNTRLPLKTKYQLENRAEYLKKLYELGNPIKHGN